MSLSELLALLHMVVKLYMGSLFGLLYIQILGINYLGKGDDRIEKPVAKTKK